MGVGGDGYGVAVENSNGKKTYMKMNFIGVGPGIGLKDFRAVFIFRNKHVFNDFVEKGWEFGGQADAAAKSGEKGMAVGGEMRAPCIKAKDGLELAQFSNELSEEMLDESVR